MSSEYFSHDYKARSDPKLIRLMMRYELKGLGAYWCVVEMLYENGGYLIRSEYERIAYELRADKDFIRALIEDFQLFEFEGEYFFSPSVLRRLKKRLDKSEKARQSVAARWAARHREDDTDVSETNNVRNTIKLNERGNEIKGNEMPPLSPNEESKDMIEDSPKKEKDCGEKERNIIPPTLAMVGTYCNKRNNGVDAEKFVDHYTAKGWKIGNEKMRDWQAAVRTWEKKTKKQQYGNV